MNVQGPIRKLISDHPTASALFGNRVYPVVAPQGATMPFAVVTVVGNAPANAKTNPSWVDNVSVEVVFWAPTFNECRQAEEAFRQAVDYFRGDVTFEAELVSIDGIHYEQTRQHYDNDSGNHYHISMYVVRINRQSSLDPMVPMKDRFFDDDTAAIAGGLFPGDLYFLTANNYYGLPYGVIKMVMNV